MAEQIESDDFTIFFHKLNCFLKKICILIVAKNSLIAMVWEISSNFTFYGISPFNCINNLGSVTPKYEELLIHRVHDDKIKIYLRMK